MPTVCQTLPYNAAMKATSPLPNNQNLRQLSAIRVVLLCVLFGARHYAEIKLAWMLPYVTLDLLFLALMGFALLAWWRSAQIWPVSEIELFAHFAIDVLGFSGVLYFSGGASNPFVSYLLVPLCLAAVALPRRYAWLMSALCLFSYTLLLFYNVPLQSLAPEHHHGSNQAHILGMWLNFVLSAALISYFLATMAHRLRRREQELASIREQELQNDQLLAVATLAAGTAHELGTPLSSIQVIGEDLEEELSDSDFADDIRALNLQTAQCKQILNKLVSTARELSSIQTQAINGATFFTQLRESWQVLRPDCSPIFNISDEVAGLSFELDGTLQQAVLNLLNNAADVSANDVELRTEINKQELVITILDRGPGMPADNFDNLRRAFVSTKGKGMGLGLFLSNSTAERFGGNLRWLARDGGGSQLELRLPLSRITKMPDVASHD
ncbi:HAMP domain-containing histidine kinase [Spongiibacter sp. KMU-158]|uniref:histidine kinase n=1 Tax=Spongiibacter pelagi TaxID=2760804 RepID=A0A927C290_9GAMM|nr:ATP-binding protein [Spongiibacter pelagi]MBD2858833.1 HAMP domain-containing histidine kinase [Spongiibacter pelagi]